MPKGVWEGRKTRHEIALAERRKTIATHGLACPTCAVNVGQIMEYLDHQAATSCDRLRWRTAPSKVKGEAPVLRWFGLQGGGGATRDPERRVAA